LESKVAASRTSAAASLEVGPGATNCSPWWRQTRRLRSGVGVALIGIGRWVWSRGAGCVSRLRSWVGSDSEEAAHGVKSTQENGLGAAPTQNTPRCRISSPCVCTCAFHTPPISQIKTFNSSYYNMVHLGCVWMDNSTLMGDGCPRCLYIWLATSDRVVNRANI
jgi:hypothetical protein